MIIVPRPTEWHNPNQASVWQWPTQWDIPPVAQELQPLIEVGAYYLLLGLGGRALSQLQEKGTPMNRLPDQIPGEHHNAGLDFDGPVHPVDGTMALKGFVALRAVESIGEALEIADTLPEESQLTQLEDDTPQAGPRLRCTAESIGLRTRHLDQEGWHDQVATSLGQPAGSRYDYLGASWQTTPYADFATHALQVYTHGEGGQGAVYQLTGYTSPHMGVSLGMSGQRLEGGTWQSEPTISWERFENVVTLVPFTVHRVRR